MVRRLRISASVGKKASRGSAPNARIASVRTGMKGILNNYNRLVNHLEAESAEILYNALLPTFHKSQEYCPKDTGALVKSGYLEITQFRGIPTVEIGYGRGGNPPYATNVHENLEWRHKAPTRAKWLQVALAEDAAEIQGRIIGQYKAAGGF